MSATDLLLALDDALAEGDWVTRVRELCTEDCEFVDVGPGVVTDIAGFIETERNMMTAWSNESTEKVALLATTVTRRLRCSTEPRTAVRFAGTDASSSLLAAPGRCGSFAPSRSPTARSVVHCPHELGSGGNDPSDVTRPGLRTPPGEAEYPTGA